MSLSLFRLGFKNFVSMGVIMTGYAVAFGVLAVQSGFSIAEACLMSLTVFAGASQFLTLPLINQGAPLLTIVGLTFAVNSRHLLYGLNVGKKYAKTDRWSLLGGSFVLTDEAYAFCLVGPGKKHHAWSYFVGTALCGYVFWNAGTAIGAFLGKHLHGIPTAGLDFMMLAVFASMVGSSIRTPREWAVVVLSGFAAIACTACTDGYIHLLFGGIGVPMLMSIGKEKALDEPTI